MRNHFYIVTSILALGASLAWGQTATQVPSQTAATPNAQNPTGNMQPSSVPMNQQNPSAAPQVPTQNPPAAADQSTIQPIQQNTSAAPVQTQSVQSSKIEQINAASSADLQSSIQAAWQQEPSLKDSSISVSQKDSGIELSGTALPARRKRPPNALPEPMPTANQ